MMKTKNSKQDSKSLTVQSKIYSGYRLDLSVLTGLLGLAIFNTSCATVTPSSTATHSSSISSTSSSSSSQIWEGTDCNEHVERTIASSQDSQTKTHLQQKAEALKASCEKAKSDKATERRLQRFDMQMIREFKRF